MAIPGGVPYQFGDDSLSTSEAYSACGPAAAVAFARANGRNPSLREAVTLARQVGWTEAGGMNGVANQKKLLDRMGVPARLDAAPTPQGIVGAVRGGEAVTISTPIHYYVADGYNPDTGQLHVGNSGRARKGGGEWMTLAQIQQRDGGINGALYTTPQPPGDSPMVTRPAAGPPRQVATPKPTDARAGLLAQRKTDLEQAQGNIAKAQAEVERLGQPGPDEDGITPAGKQAARQRQAALHTAQNALNSANQTARRVASDIRRLESQVAANQDNANVQRDPAGQAAAYARPSTITPGRGEKSVGVFNPQTGQIEYTDNPNYVDPANEPMTPAQVANVEVSRMNAAAAMMHAQVAEGTLTFSTAKDFLDRVEKTPPLTQVGDKWYYTGMEPGGFYQQLGQKYGYKASVVEANVADIAAVLGHPEYNSALVSGPYKRALEQGGVKTGKDAGSIALAGAPSGPQDNGQSDQTYSPNSANPAPGEVDQAPKGPQFGTPLAGEPGGATQPEVVANEQAPPPAPTFGPPAPKGPVYGSRPGTQYPGDTGSAPPGPQMGMWRNPQEPVEETSTMRTYTSNGLPPGATEPFPPAAQPTPDQRTQMGLSAPIGAQGGATMTAAGPQMGSSFRDRMIQHLVTEQGKSPEDAARIADAYIAQQGG